MTRQDIKAPADDFQDILPTLEPKDTTYSTEQSKDPEKDGGVSSTDAQGQSGAGVGKVERPPLVWDSGFAAFRESLVERLRSVFSKRLLWSLFAGQFVSLCITCTSVVTTALVQRGFNAPTFQNLFLYFSLMCIYTPYTIYKYGFKGYANLIYRDGWKYCLLAAIDVEGNFLAVKSYQYTTLLSCMLLDCWAIPVCMFFQWVWQRPRYHWTQILGVFITLTGLAIEVVSDHNTDKDYPATSMVKGDLFMILGATFYGISNATEEMFVRHRPLYEVVGQMGLWGTLINGIQAAGLEHEMIKTSTWNGMIAGLLIAYSAAMLFLYTVAPILYRMASSTYYNLSILSSDFYGLLFGLFLYHYKPYFLYFISFPVTIIGLIVYFWSLPLETQGKLDVKPPEYVDARAGGRTLGDLKEELVVRDG